jgi:hypothetical protein
VFLAGLVLAQCGFPPDDTVKTDFLRENPSVTVVGVASGEGDGDTVYKIIRFRTPGSAAVCQVEWGYQRTESDSRAFRILPLHWRNGLHEIIARNRLRWFGKRKICYRPDQRYADRFLA